MSKKHWRLVWAVIAAEVALILGLLAWAVLRPAPATAPGQEHTSQSAEPVTVKTALLAEGLAAPTDIAAASSADDDTRLFVTERPGTIKRVDTNSGEAAPFLDITAKVKDNGAEMGLLGLAFHPDYAENGFFYVNYTDKQDTTVIARYHVGADGQADPTSEKVLLKVTQPFANHNGGGLTFGPDGLLYVALGDGGSGGDPGNRAQNKNDLLGKILRVDVDQGDPYAVPADNPFADEAGARPEIWAYGLRNPWRIAFDTKTDELYIADVGQNNIEEVDVQPTSSKGGENYGWRCFEGTESFNSEGCQGAENYTKPAFQYSHENERCSITGGYVYRGQKIAGLDGVYVYGDLCSGEIFSARQRNGEWLQTLLVKTAFQITTFGQDARGELYVADLNGSIHRLEKE